MGLDLNPLDWPGDLVAFAASSPPVEEALAFALKRLLGFDAPWSLVRLGLMLEGDVWSSAQQAAGLWWRMESGGLDPWRLLGEILDGIASFGPGGFIRDRVRTFWNPIWHAMDMLEEPTKAVESFVYAAQDALDREMKRMLDGQQARAIDQVSIDNAKMQAALTELKSRFSQNRRANGTLRDALYLYIPDAAGLAANGIDLFELIMFIAAIIASDGIAVLAAPEVLDTMASENYDIFAIAILAGYDAVAVWLAAQNIDLQGLPHQIAEVAANPPAPWVSSTLLADEQTLEANGCSIDTIRSFTSNAQITSGYIHEIVQYHPMEACVILGSVDTILRNGDQLALGGLVATEDDLRLTAALGLKGATFAGALFHIQWMAHHAGDIKAIEQPVKAGDRPDVLKTDDTVLDCKSVKNIDYSATEDQVNTYRKSYPGHPIEYVYNGDKLLLGNQKSNLSAIQTLRSNAPDYEGINVSVVFSQRAMDDPANANFIAQLRQLNVPIEVWDNVVIETPVASGP